MGGVFHNAEDCADLRLWKRGALCREGLLARARRNPVTREFIATTGVTYTDEVTRDLVFRFHKALRSRGLAERTVSNKRKRLRSFCILQNR
jgi:hypothetical protein